MTETGNFFVLSKRYKKKIFWFTFNPSLIFYGGDFFINLIPHKESFMSGENKNNLT